ncbi:hypothetical protein BDV26DRAFT_152451 [Aspergillus bertholletiae]|uniref:Uncharacterized protein n=1 Tax=Aspergillus bertholletiae TaxID=1226010 RepID=A0A5N7AMC1_9EURO|nr:hypothetical protein BDV26DRAFT_152451 [Aspergillus bertholletiae]
MSRTLTYRRKREARCETPRSRCQDKTSAPHILLYWYDFVNRLALRRSRFCRIDLVIGVWGLSMSIVKGNQL